MKKLWAILILCSMILVPIVMAEEGEEGESSGVHFMFGAITITFGIVALIWTYNARKKLAVGSSLRQYISNFLIALLLIVAASGWHLLREVTAISSWLGEAAEYPEYFLYILAFLVFVLAAYQMRFISQEFNFDEQASSVNEAIAKKKNKK